VDVDRILIRAIFTFITLLALLRISGKRAIAQGSTLDFVVALIIGDMVDDGVYGQSPMSQFVVGTSAVILAHIVSSLIATHSPRFHHWTDGKPAVLLVNGRVNKVALRHERLSWRVLTEQLRLQGVVPHDRKTIRRAMLEVHGRLTILLREPFKPVQKRDREQLRTMRK
jgi:uncharacterized membrane protein YcaP (DUF421 family)